MIQSTFGNKTRISTLNSIRIKCLSIKEESPLYDFTIYISTCMYCVLRHRCVLSAVVLCFGTMEIRKPPKSNNYDKGQS